MITGSIYFLGEYRPAYFEASTVDLVVCMMESALRHAQDPQWFLDRIQEAKKQIKKENCAAYCCDHSNKGIALAKRPHDPFLDSVTATFPQYPGLDYSLACNR